MEIKHEGDHYALYISGKFIGSYDTVMEAVHDYEEFRKENGL